MGEFTAQDAIRPRWDPRLKTVAVWRFLYIAAALLALAVVGGIVMLMVSGLQENPLAWLILVVGPFASSLASVVVAGTLQVTGIIGRILPKVAFGLFIGSVIGIIVFVWACALLFGYVQEIVASTFNQGAAALTYVEILHYLTAGTAAAGRNDPPFCTALSAYLIWPFQFNLLRDLLIAFGALGFVSLTASFAIWWERKVAGRIQSRLGPMRVGGWHGWAQSVADGLKLIQKEDICIAGADRPLFKLAPYLVFIPVLAALIALPFGADWAFRDLDVALIFILSMVGIDVVGVILGGWASNNKWSVYGAMRVAAQMVSYEIPMGMALLIPVMTVGTLQLTTIGEAQSGGLLTWLAFANPFTFVASVVYFVASLASCKRAPFDLPEAESELVAGFHTEYSGFRWAVFFFGEYAAMFVVAGLATILFFGAWHSPLPAAWGASLQNGTLWGRALYGLLFSGPLWFVAKAYGFLYVHIWLRWTLPRVRIDQVMYACVQVLLPMTMVLLLGNTFWMLLVPAGGMVSVVLNVAMAAIGVVPAAGFVTIAVYGFVNRRRLVGTLVVNHLPGA